MVKVLIHGGAWNAQSEAIKNKEQAATDRTCAALNLAGSSALDIVEQAVAAQELEKSLDAGIGSVIQMDGRIRMDAGICDSEGRYGAVLQIEHVATPVRVARRILDMGYHSILSGEGARLFALEEGFPSVSPFVDYTVKEYLEKRAEYSELTYAALVADVKSLNERKLGTVGAVAIDDQGRLAAACSTGGLSFSYPGRVGDTALLGGGVYASEHVAVACTGEGDKIVRRLSARRVEDGFLRHGSLIQAVEESLQDLREKEGGYGGIIAISRTGEVVSRRSTSFMSTATRAV